MLRDFISGRKMKTFKYVTKNKTVITLRITARFGASVILFTIKKEFTINLELGIAHFLDRFFINFNNKALSRSLQNYFLDLFESNDALDVVFEELMEFLAAITLTDPEFSAFEQAVMHASTINHNYSTWT